MLGKKNRPAAGPPQQDQGKTFKTVPPSLAGVKHIVAIASGKGGVGKSTVASNLAVALTKNGKSVGLLDADIYGPSQPGMLGAAGARPDVDGNRLRPLTRHGIQFVSMGLLTDKNSPVVWRAPMATKMIHQFIGSVDWGTLDYLLVDLPPGTGDVQLTLAQQAALSGAVIVTTPQRVALDVAAKGLKMFEQVHVPILGVIENMAGFTCGHCGELTEVFAGGGGRQLATESSVPYLGAIPLDPMIVMGGDDGTPIALDQENPSAQVFYSVAAELEKSIAERAGADLVEPVSVSLSPEGELIIEWPDSHLSKYSPYSLRNNCRCAACVDENTGKKILDEKRVPLDLGIASVRAVGRYALLFAFSDQHDTGIYKYELLRSLCECPDCMAKRGEENKSFSV